MKNEIKSDGIGRLAKFMADKFTESAPAPAVGHTPLPWLLTDGLVYRDATGRHVTQQLCHEYGRAALMLTHDGSEEGYANAELAKLSCNSHAALLAERDRLRTALSQIIADDRTAGGIVAIARAALSEGGNEAPPFPEHARPRLQASVTTLRLKTAAALRCQDLEGAR